MTRENRFVINDPLDAFLKALVHTRGTVKDDSASAAELDQMIGLAARLLDEQRAEDKAWEVLEAIMPRSIRALFHG